MIETFYQLNTPLHIALVTDTHNTPPDAVLDSLRRQRPDIICIAGDFIYARLPEEGLKMDQSPWSLELLSGCAGIAPTYVSLGNHEWMLNSEDMERIIATGVTVLDNDYVKLPGHSRQRQTGHRINLPKVSDDIIIGGLSSAHYMAYQAYCAALKKTEDCHDSTNLERKHQASDNLFMKTNRIYPVMQAKDHRIQSAEPDVRWLSAFCMESGYKILLCHHPEYYPARLKAKDIDLILSGHAHGGQIRIFGQGLYAPGQGIFPRLTSGVVDGRLVISRGLANNTLIPRLFNPEEIVYIR